MSRLQKKVKLHFKLPTRYNDGREIADKEYVRVKGYFIDSYGGLSTNLPLTGYWKSDSGIIFTDETIEYFTFISQTTFDKKVKSQITKQIDDFKSQFKQLEILCYYHTVMSN
ncbi:MAG: hypothetical protein KGH81_06275 [Thaumarchaeota archaeon]|nr:hypothetical protein [Nitrososphaerota archaeon]